MQTGYATAARAAQIVPQDASNAMKSAWFVRKMSFAPIAEPALTVSAARETIALNACCVNSVRITYVNAAGDAPNARLSVNRAVKNVKCAQTVAFARTAESALTAWAVMETTVLTATFVNSA